MISGVPAAGKTTVGRLLASRLPKAVCVPGDTIRAMVVSGRADMVSDAGEAELAQLLLRYRSALAVAAVYLEAGFDAIVEDVIIGPVLGEFLALVPVPELHLVFLDPDATALADRDKNRTKTAYSDERWDVHELRGVLRGHTSRLGLWLDSTQQTAEQTVDEILADLDASLVRTGQPAAPQEARPRRPDMHGNDALDEGLGRLATTGPEYGGGLSNHGPMAAEALVRLGRADAVGHWLDGYLRRLDEAPRASDRVTDENWRDALGRLNRVADWAAYLGEQLGCEPWRDVLARWWPRLLPGVAAAATHGIIRTSHAARSLAAAEDDASSGPRRDELARALGYWAASYVELPGSVRPGGELDVAHAVRALPVLPEPPAGGLISVRLKAGLAAQPGFGAAASRIRRPGDPAEALRDLAGEFTTIFLGYGRAQPITFLHAVTAPVAAYSALPLLPPELARPTYDALWQVAAALYSVHAGGVTPEQLPAGPPPVPEDLADRAVATGDEHAIKLTEACVRLHARTPDPVFLHAAARASDLLGG